MEAGYSLGLGFVFSKGGWVVWGLYLVREAGSLGVVFSQGGR